MYGRWVRQSGRSAAGWFLYLFAVLGVVSLAFRIAVHFGVI